MKFTKTRNYLEIRVGSNQCVEVVLYLRRGDLYWFNASAPEADETKPDDAEAKSKEASLFDDFLQLLQDDILPRMFQDEMEDYFYATNRHIKPPPKNIGPGGVAIAELNSAKESKPDAGKVNGKKRKRISKKAARLQQQMQLELQRAASVKSKDVYYSFGSRLRLMYRLDLQQSPNQGETLVFRDPQPETETSGNKQENGELLSSRKFVGDYRALKKLSKRLLIWVFPSAEEGRTDDSNNEGGFPRPEMVPLADLFQTNETKDDDPHGQQGNKRSAASLK